MSRIYTKKGDTGTTELLSGERILKSDPRIHVLGSLDELDCVIGWALVEARRVPGYVANATQLQRVQFSLYHVAAELASTTPDPAKQVIRDSDVEKLESEIDELTAAMPPLDHFILPGGSELAARLHMARTVVRRVERNLVGLAVRGTLLRYINRMSDWFFTQARYANYVQGVSDVKHK